MFLQEEFKTKYSEKEKGSFYSRNVLKRSHPRRGHILLWMGFLVFIAYLLCTILNIKEFNNTRKYYDSILQMWFGLRNNRRWYLDKILRMNELNPPFLKYKFLVNSMQNLILTSKLNRYRNGNKKNFKVQFKPCRIR